MKGDPITSKPTGTLTRQQLIDSRCNIPWADDVQAILNDLSDGTKRIDLVYKVGADIKSISEKDFEDLRDAVVELIKRHNLENPKR
jgi:hypothetical protein